MGMRKIGVFGGSFNPVHIGHIRLARYLKASEVLDEVWLTLSPQNPLKDAETLISDEHRLAMLRLATAEIREIEVCDIELSMPRPSYTINTLELLSSHYPDCRFKLIIGSDNWLRFEQWREARRIIAEYGVIIYPRPGYEIEKPIEMQNVELVAAPMTDISSTQLRRAIALGESVDDYLPQSVIQYINDNKLYK